MTHGVRDLSFSMKGYDHRGACALLARRNVPAWMRHAPAIYLGGWVVVLMAVAIAVRFGYRSNGLEIYIVAIAGFLALMWAIGRRRALTWRLVDEAPLRAGINRTHISDEGLSFLSDGARTTLFWSHIRDVVPGKDGLLVLAGDFDYFPIRAEAFADSAARDDMLHQLRLRIAEAKGKTHDRA